MKELIEKIVSCPIGYELFIYPLITNNGHTYEKAYIDKIKFDKKLDPLSRTEVSFLTLNRLLKDIAGLFNNDKFSEKEGRLSIDSQQVLEKVLTCPLSKKLFLDPVITNNGHTYERQDLKEYIKKHGLIDPFTKEPIDCLIKNYAIVSLTTKFQNDYKGGLDTQNKQNPIVNLTFEKIEQSTEISVKPEAHKSAFFFTSPNTEKTAKQSLFFDKNINCYYVLRLSIIQVFNMYQKICTNEGYDFDLYLRQTLGGNRAEIMDILDRANIDSEPSDKASILLELLRPLMWYPDFSLWRPDTIQQGLISYLLIKTELYETAEIQWGGKPKNCHAYYAFFHKLMQEFIKNCESQNENLNQDTICLNSANL